jgi:predicted LPLAT superfamily acyltransferase
MQTKAKKRGNRLGFWFFRVFLQFSGLSGAYGLLYVVCLYYLIFDRSAVSAAMAYIKRRFRAYGLFRRYLSVYRLFISQGRSLIDRYVIGADPGKFTLELRGYDVIKDILTDSQRGVILLSAHVGNWQAAITALKKLKRTVYLVMTAEENEAVKNVLNLERDRVRIISPDNFLGGIIEIVKVIDEGNIVSIMGDRSYGHDATEVSLLGDRASLPTGAFSIATSVKCPVVVLLSAKVSRNKYIIDVSHIIMPASHAKARKKEDVRELVQRFAGILEEYAEQYPFQWFVFRDIWKSKT